MSPERAAHVIQVNLRRYVVVRRRLHSVAAIKAKFDSLRSSFVAPESFIFDSAKSTDAEPILAYSAPNAAYHAYVESLTHLLTDLDGIASEGSHAVKADRKQLAVAVEEELSRLEKAKLQAWEDQKRSSSPPAPAEAAVAVNGNEPSTESQNVDIPAADNEPNTDTNDTTETHVHFAEHEDSPESATKATTVSDDEEENEDHEVAAALVPAASAAPLENDQPMSAVLEERHTSSSEMHVDADAETETEAVEGYEVVAPTDVVESDHQDVENDLGTATSAADSSDSSAENAPLETTSPAAAPAASDDDNENAEAGIMTLDEDTHKDNPFDDEHGVQHDPHHSDSGSDTEFEML